MLLITIGGVFGAMFIIKYILLPLQTDYTYFKQKHHEYIRGYGRFVACFRIFYILSLSTHGLFFTDQGPGPGLQAGFTGVGRCLKYALKSPKK